MWFKSGVFKVSRNQNNRGSSGVCHLHLLLCVSMKIKCVKCRMACKDCGCICFAFLHVWATKSWRTPIWASWLKTHYMGQNTRSGISLACIHGLYLWVINIQIMNVYECNGTNIFMRWKMKCSIQRGAAELNGTCHLSPNENICSIAFAQHRVSHIVFLINLILEQTTEDCIRNTEYSNINVNDECNSK